MNNAAKLFPDSCRFQWTNGTGGAISSGALVRANGRYGVATKDIASGATGTVVFEGQFTFTKGTGYTLSEGQAVAWDGTKIVDAGTVETPPVGRATLAAVSNDTVCTVTLGPVAPRCIKHTVTAGEDSGNQADIDLGTGRAPSQIVSVQIESTANVRRVSAGAVTALSGGNLGKVRVVDSGLAVNEVIHLSVLD